MITLSFAAVIQEMVNKGRTVFAQQIIVETDHHYVVIFPWQGETIICIRGTDELHDWHDVNLKAWQTSFAGHKAHAGFVQAYIELYVLITRALHQLDPSSRGLRRPLVIIGHSMGGAVAQLLAYTRHNLVSQVVTFGQPRVFSPKLAKAYDRVLADKTTRIVNERDIVPCVPGALFFRHTRERLYLDGGKAKAIRWFRRTVRAIASAVPKLFGLRDWDHTMDAYRHATVKYERRTLL